MPHLCMFGGHGGQLVPGRDIYMTAFGGTDVRRIPVASQLVQSRKHSAVAPDGSYYMFLTLFGGTTVLWPTLAEEYLALRDALRGGALTLDDWDRLVAPAGGAGPLRVHSLTLMGSFDADVLPREDKELDDLTMQRHLGHIPEAAVQVLILAIGQTGAPRLAAVRQAVALARSAGA